jgi:TonB family protein
LRLPLGFRSLGPAVLSVFVALNCAAMAIGGDLLLIPEGIAKHAALQKPSPTITPLARQMKVSGRVEVSVEISHTGSVTKTKVVSGNPLLAESVVLAVKSWRFQPFVQNGSATAARTVLSFDFKQ